MGDLSTTDTVTRIAIIGGSGFGAALLPGDSQLIETQYGQAAVTVSRLEDNAELVFLARHGAGHRLPPHRVNHKANIAALKSLGACAVFATAAVGSLRKELTPGDFVILDDFVDFTKGEPVTFFDEPGNVRHTDFSEPYSPELRERLLQTADTELGATVHPCGTYLCVSGPRYETPAEVRLFAQWGLDVVGMTSAPEAILSREVNVPYAAIAIITNYGCGLVANAALSHGEVEAQMEHSRAALASWLLRAARLIGHERRKELTQ